jgi:hypothetical protein
MVAADSKVMVIQIMCGHKRAGSLIDYDFTLSNHMRCPYRMIVGWLVFRKTFLNKKKYGDLLPVVLAVIGHLLSSYLP